MNYIKNIAWMQWIFADQARAIKVIAITIVVLLLMIFVEKVRATVCGALTMAVIGGIIGLIGMAISDKVLDRDLMIAVIAMAVLLIGILTVSSIFVESGDKGEYCFDLIVDGVEITIKIAMLCTVILIPAVIGGIKGANLRGDRY